MKKNIYHISLIIFGIFIPTLVYANDINTIHLAKIQHLINQSLIYDNGANADSIQIWEEQLSPILEAEQKYTLLFQIKLLSVKSSVQAGNTSIALNKARNMYQKAKDMNYPLGLGLALCAIGDTYTNSNNPQKGIDSYEEALELLEKESDKGDWIKDALCQYILIKTKAEQTDNIIGNIQQLEIYSKEDTSISAKFSVPLCYASYYTHINRLQEALVCLK